MLPNLKAIDQRYTHVVASRFGASGHAYGLRWTGSEDTAYFRVVVSRPNRGGGMRAEEMRVYRFGVTGQALTGDREPMMRIMSGVEGMAKLHLLSLL